MSAASSFFQRIPFIRITTLFLAGIILSDHTNLNKQLVAILLVSSLSFLILFWHNSNFVAARIQNILVLVSIFLSGLFYPKNVQEKLHPEFSRKEYFLAEVYQKPKQKEKSYQSIVSIQNRNLIHPEKVIVYFSKENFDPTITTGDQLVLLIKPQAIRKTGNPFEFDYQKMMLKKGIIYSAYLSNGSYLKTGNHLNRIEFWGEKIRDKLIAKLFSSRLEKEELSVVSALTLGYRAELEPDTIDYFASTGSMHVLAVSGLHVGLIYFILVFLLSGIKQIKYGNFIFPILIIVFLWIYAFISGFSPSVQRATVMFSFIVIGNILRRPVNIYNSLTASALALMLYSPNVIYEVGFQLSYLAVFGIVLIQPQLSKIIEVKNKILNGIWDLTTVSIAAQLATFPLGFYYFNQFPNYFWLSNLVVIPAATVIIWLTFVFFCTSPLPVISDLISELIQWSTHFMLKFLKILSQFPHSVSENIVVTQLQVWLLYTILIFILTYWFSKRKLWLFGMLISILFFQASVFTSNLRLRNQKVIFAYNSKNNLLHFINGRHNYLICLSNDSISELEFKMVQRVINQLKLSDPSTIYLRYTPKFNSNDLIIENNAITFLNSAIYPIQTKNSKYSNLATLTLTVKKGNSYLSDRNTITITMNNSRPTNKNIKGQIFNTKTDGAFTLNLK